MTSSSSKLFPDKRTVGKIAAIAEARTAKAITEKKEIGENQATAMFAANSFANITLTSGFAAALSPAEQMPITPPKDKLSVNATFAAIP